MNDWAFSFDGVFLAWGTVKDGNAAAGSFEELPHGGHARPCGTGRCSEGLRPEAYGRVGDGDAQDSARDGAGPRCDRVGDWGLASWRGGPRICWVPGWSALSTCVGTGKRRPPAYANHLGPLPGQHLAPRVDDDRSVREIHPEKLVMVARDEVDSGLVRELATRRVWQPTDDEGSRLGVSVDVRVPLVDVQVPPLAKHAREQDCRRADSEVCASLVRLAEDHDRELASA